MAGNDAFEARYSPTRSLLLAAGSLAFVAIGLWMIGAIGDAPMGGSRRLPDWAVPIIGWISIAFFGPVGILHLLRAFKPGLAVRIDRDGMFIANYSAEPIPWDDFVAMTTQNIMGTNMLLFEVSDAREVELSWLKRVLMLFNRATSGMGGSLVVNNTNRSHTELIDALVRHAPQRLTQTMASF